MPASDHEALRRAFADVAVLYIADGHHRAASAARARRALAGRGAGEHDRMLAVAFPDNQVQVLPYHRVVKDLHGMSAEEFVAAVSRQVALAVTADPTPSGRGHVTMYVAGQWYSLALQPAAAGAGGETAAQLDVSVLQTQLLAPVLGIADIRTDKRIDFVGGIRGIPELTRLVDSGASAVAFALHPVTVRDLMVICDAGAIMPPKSTWFEPKLRDGLLSHLISAPAGDASSAARVSS